MDGKDELEEGEIEDDGEFLQELEEELRLRKQQNNKKPVATKSKVTSSKENAKSEDGKGKENVKKTAKKTALNKDEKSYEMDDYELLLARHQLIQQQLEKVQAEDEVKGIVVKTRTTKIRGKRKKTRIIIKPDNLKSTKNEVTAELIDTKGETKQEPAKETNEEIKKDSSPKVVKQEDEDLELFQMRAALLAQTSKKKTKDPPGQTTVQNEKNLVDLTEVSEVIDLTNDEKVNASETKVNDIKGNKNSKNKTNQDSQNGKQIPVLGTKMVTKNRTLNNTVQPNKQIVTQPNIQLAVLQNKQTPKSGKKRRRGGKRTKMLAYRAQQKRELAILEQQQAIAFDNYNTVPMDIENNESNDVMDGVAPLPLIETPSIPPPPPPLPPSDSFKPVEDQIKLSMTTNNVAWMPGYMERLEPDNLNQTSQHDSNKEIVTGKENENNNNEAAEKDKVDEKEVWALRAQALKSLACKRASKAKMTKKVSPQTKKETTTKKNALLKDAQINDLSPLPSPTSVTSQPIAIPIKVGELISKYKAPVHAPVVIKLGKEDFESSGDEDSATTTRAKVQRRRISATDEELITELLAYTNKAKTKVKSHSLLVQKDQLEYKKLNNELGEKKILFRKQTEEVKALQAKLQAALREKVNTRKSYNKLHSMLLDVKSGLKEKISLRKKVQEDLLKAKALVGNDRTIGKSKLSNKVRDNIITLSTNFRRAFVDMSKIESYHLMSESSQEDEPVSEATTSSENDVKKKLLRRTAASVRNMSKEDLSRLELELREQLKSYQRTNKNLNKQNTNNKKEEQLDKKISISNLPSISTQSDLNKLKGTLNKEESSHTIMSTTNTTGLLDKLQRKDLKNNQIVFSKELSAQSNIDIKSRVGEKYEEKSVTFKYKSPLLRFRSYRLNPYYRTQNKYSIKSPSFTNMINARKTMCKFDLLGTCNDEKCSYWHFNDACELSPEDLIQDLVSYDPALFDATDSMNSDTKQKLLHSFTQQFTAQYDDKISTEEQLLILWNKLKERRISRKIPVYECVSFARREWLKLCRLKSQSHENKDDSINLKAAVVEPFYYLKTTKKNSTQDSNAPHYESQEVRYYSDAYQITAIMEEALSENPNDVKLWLSLARYHLKDKEANDKEAVEKALGVLSRSLEVNRNSEDLWIEYLSLFSKHGSADELREISYQAVMYSPTYNVWWTCLSLETTHLGKQEICTEMMKFIMDIEEESEETISNALLETLLYLCKLLQDRDRCKLAYDCLAAALGMGKVDDSAEKISIEDLRKHLTLNDVTFLWICFISVKCFHAFPEHLFPTEVYGPGRLVNKKNFVLDWNKKSFISEKEIRATLQLAAFESFPDRPISPVKSAIMLYENLAFFEIHTKNFQNAGDILRLLTTEENGFTDGWILLLSLYMKHSPMDAIVKVAEEAIHKCDHDVTLVHIYSKWLYKKGMPSLALDKLTKCIHTYFQVGPEDPEYVVDILYLYRAVLGLEVPYNVNLPVYLPKASSGVKFYYWMCYCLLLKIREVPPTSSLFNSAADEAFESAVHQYASRDTMKRLWDAYMEHKLEEFEGRTITARMCNQLVDLLLRSVVAIPSTSSVRENKNILWKDFTFQNQMVEKCMNCVPESQQSKVYRKLINLMPDNVALAQRICEHEMKMGNLQQVRAICGAILRNYPKFIPLWTMAIQVERKSNSIREARWLFEEAVKSNPCNAKLWREYASFEITCNTDPGKLDETLSSIIERSSTNGIDIREYLRNLAPG